MNAFQFWPLVFELWELIDLVVLGGFVTFWCDRVLVSGVVVELPTSVDLLFGE